SVLKTEEDMTRKWVDNRLTVACKYGFTLIYDELTRSRPEANNVLLSVLQEKMMDLPPARESGSDYLRVDPDFTAIFTSNPEEYAGVFRSQDALRDRMVTLDLDNFDERTEVAITESKSGLAESDARKIVQVVRALRKGDSCEFSPTVRGCLMIAKTTVVTDARVSKGDPVFVQTCQDILGSETSRIGSSTSQVKVRKAVKELVEKYC
ncbi:MAG: AAA family ATPase, partial [Actinobacteria bacterium]|nr:AAA family ATPase [Actinomycetota bacterium]